MKRTSIYQTLTSRTSQVRRQDNQVWDQTGLSGWRHVGVGVVLKGRVCVCAAAPAFSYGSHSLRPRTRFPGSGGTAGTSGRWTELVRSRFHIRTASAPDRNSLLTTGLSRTKRAVLSD